MDKFESQKSTALQTMGAGLLGALKQPIVRGREKPLSLLCLEESLFTLWESRWSHKSQAARVGHRPGLRRVEEGPWDITQDCCPASSLWGDEGKALFSTQQWGG